MQDMVSACWVPCHSQMPGNVWQFRVVHEERSFAVVCVQSAWCWMTLQPLLLGCTYMFASHLSERHSSEFLTYPDSGRSDLEWPVACGREASLMHGLGAHACKRRRLEPTLGVYSGPVCARRRVVEFRINTLANSDLKVFLHPAAAVPRHLTAINVSILMLP